MYGIYSPLPIHSAGHGMSYEIIAIIATVVSTNFQSNNRIYTLWLSFF